MDPLSIIASSLALGTAVHASLSVLLKLHALRDYHADIESLIKEIEDIRTTLSQAESALKTRQSQGQYENSLASLSILRCHCILEELERSLRPIVIGNDTTGRFKWLLRKRSILAVRQSLHDARITLLIALVQTEMSDTAQIRQVLDHLAASTELTLETNNTILAAVLQEQTMVRSDIYTVRVLLEQMLVQEKKDVAHSFMPQGDSGTDIDVDLASIQASPPSELVEESTCRACSCRCHYRFSVETPRFARWFMGSSLFAFSGFPLGSCSERQCQRQQEFKARLTYRFPSWFLSRMLSISCSTGICQSLNIILRMPRIVPDDADILRYTAQGNEMALRDLFSQGAASPHDVGHIYGLTPLHIALFKRNLMLCEFLVSVGADPYLNTGRRRCVIDIVREDILRKRLSPNEIIVLKRLFIDVDDLESFNFTPVHKCVLGISDIPLDQLLSISTSLIDSRDSQGRTPLLWAASSRNAEAVQILLRYGASPHIATKTGQSPLHHAIEYNSTESARHLIQAGANVDHQNCRGRTPLHYSCRLDDQAQMSRLLIEAGANVNVRDCAGSSPLHEAVQYCREVQLKVLLEAHADLYAIDDSGRTPLDLVDSALESEHTLDDRKRSGLVSHLIMREALLEAMSGRISNQNRRNSGPVKSPNSPISDDRSEPPSYDSIEHLNNPVLSTDAYDQGQGSSATFASPQRFVYRHYEGFGDLARVSGNRGLLALSS